MSLIAKRAKAQKKLMRDGQQITLLKATAGSAGTYNPLTNEVDPPVGPPAPASWTFFGIVTTETNQYIDGKIRQWNDEFHSGTAITTSLTKLLLSAGYVDAQNVVHYDIIPVEGDKVTTADGVTYTIQTTGAISPTGVTVVWDMTVAK